MKKLTKEEMKVRVIAWVEEIKAWQEKGNENYPFMKKYDIDYDSLYRIEDAPRKDRRSAFKFFYDGELYERIEYYRTDGAWKESGEAFEALTDGTDWFHECEQQGIEYFVRLG